MASTNQEFEQNRLAAQEEAKWLTMEAFVQKTAASEHFRAICCAAKL